ncbi:glycosyltransferase family 2 protein [Aeromicrobium sp.]|uniref:glycosyltransferase n=1 Tax=Aeromicrobium sp. TaxID=1871063 RepID=UPI0019B780A8|nr:glycosyltransferase family 2 protein [Aeromicrobium sp.]MBC7632674.1 glycosyltransferase family 2 protein [Aeromicrobium sp.]
MTTTPFTIADLAIVVVTYGSPDLLRTHLAPTAAGLPGATVVVVDNRRDDTSSESIRGIVEEHGWILMANSRNVGFGAAVDAGVARGRELGASCFLILNPDASIDRGGVLALLKACEEPLTLASASIRRPDGSVWFDGADLHLKDGSTRSTRRRGPTAPDEVMEWLTGACLMASWELWQTVGGFEPEYFLYWEDIDLSFRVLAAGGTLRVIQEAVAVHDVGGTQERDSQGLSGAYCYYNSRNRLVFAARNLDEAVARRWMRSSLPAAWDIVLRGGRRQLLHSRTPLWSALRGVRDGRRLARAELRRRADALGPVTDG